ncbi:MAG TPA: AraC family transcriptional regulator, partial [Pelomicrobium sp.]|nr:AraC family transcriptional regulator [Pelomicrobium sp.]
MLTMDNLSTAYARIERAIRYLARHAGDQPELAEAAAAAGLSLYHFQRLFTRWAGVSPKRFVELLTVEHAKGLLRDSASVLDAALAVGLSGPGRLHDQFVAL